LIDNIFTNDLNNYAFSGLLLSDISDHLPISSIFNKKFEGKDEASYFLNRDKSSKNVAEFRSCLSQTNLFDLDDISDPVRPMLVFLMNLVKHINCFPIKKIKSERSKISKPWLSKGLLH
jgi:Leucine-rich repeat (LRR) protein